MSTTPAVARQTIELAIEANWTATRIAWPNIPFEPTSTESWLKVDFLWGAGQVLTKGGLNYVTGVLQLAVFGPKDEGDGDVLALAETARGLFNRDTFQGILFGAASGPVTLVEDSWRQIIISVPFRVEELVS